MCESPEAVAAFPCKAQVFEMDHAITTLAIRLEMDGKVIAYCPDTGYCENAVKSACNADLLIAECALRSGREI